MVRISKVVGASADVGVLVPVPRRTSIVPPAFRHVSVGHLLPACRERRVMELGFGPCQRALGLAVVPDPKVCQRCWRLQSIRALAAGPTFIPARPSIPFQVNEGAFHLGDTYHISQFLADAKEEHLETGHSVG
jgi:hypothetical protein